jgi:hypothetical protein
MTNERVEFGPYGDTMLVDAKGSYLGIIRAGLVVKMISENNDGEMKMTISDSTMKGDNRIAIVHFKKPEGPRYPKMDELITKEGTKGISLLLRAMALQEHCADQSSQDNYHALHEIADNLEAGLQEYLDNNPTLRQALYKISADRDIIEMKRE